MDSDCLDTALAPTQRKYARSVMKTTMCVTVIANAASQMLKRIMMRARI